MREAIGFKNDKFSLVLMFFVRLLVASMQSICLEEVGGENQVHPNLQGTTFIQQTFGGRLRSMVYFFLLCQCKFLFVTFHDLSVWT